MRQIIRFQSSGKRLYGVLHNGEQPLGCGFVMCAPFGEEAKSAYRTYFEMAEIAAAKGWSVLRFDYRGTGNSEGGFDEFSPSAALADIRSAMEWLRLNRVRRVGLLGLGLGATLAFELAAAESCDFMIAWEPIVNGEEFHKLNVKRHLLRQMLVRGKAAKGSPATAAASGDIIDLDGYPVRRSTAEEIRKLDLLELQAPTMPPAFILQISFSQNLAADLQALADSCHPSPQTASVVCEPFWNRIGSVNCEPVYEATITWLDKQLEAFNRAESVPPSS